MQAMSLLKEELSQYTMVATGYSVCALPMS